MVQIPGLQRATKSRDLRNDPEITGRKPIERPTLLRPSRKPTDPPRLPPTRGSTPLRLSFLPPATRGAAGPSPLAVSTADSAAAAPVPPTRVPAPTAAGPAPPMKLRQGRAAATRVLWRGSCGRNGERKRSRWGSCGARVGSGRAVPERGRLRLRGRGLGLGPGEKRYPHKRQ